MSQLRDLLFADLGLWPWAAGAFLLWLAAWGLLALRRRQNRATLRYSSLDRLRRLRPGWRPWARRALRLLRVAVILLLLVAVLRPQTGRSQTQVRTEGIDIVLVLDTSGSMQALDLDADRAVAQRRNRLEVTTAVVDEFVGRRGNDQIGLVVFGDQAFTQCPLTLDHSIVATLLEDIEIGMAGDGTAIGSALGVAVKRLQDSKADSKVIVLLTDGRNNAGVLAPTKAAEVAAAFGIKVYTIGAGAQGQAPFLVDTFFGRQVVYEDVEIDEETLRTIAETTGGKYFRAEDDDALLTIYREIDELETTEITLDTYTQYDERFDWFVLPALTLLLLEVGLLSTVLRRLP
ncbi:MAG: VWA domain-containing protein [Acidobacteriota bacterium]